MLTIELSYEEMTDLSSAICAKIILTEQYIKTLNSLTENGFDSQKEKEREEERVKRLKGIWKKLNC